MASASSVSRSAGGGGGGSSGGGGGRTAASSDREAFNSALRRSTPNNAYICDLKIQEPDPDRPTRPKLRYLIAAVDRDTGKVTLNKAKKNPNGSYSIGKVWDLNLLQQVEVHSPTTFTITLARPYAYTSDSGGEQEAFLRMIITVFRQYTGDVDGPSLVNIVVPPGSTRTGGSSRNAATASSGGPVQSSSANNGHDELTQGRPSTSSMQSNGSSQGVRPPRAPKLAINTSLSDPSTPTSEMPAFISSTASPSASTGPGSGLTVGREHGVADSSLRRAASSSRLQVSQPVPQLPTPTSPAFGTSSKTSATTIGSSSTDDSDPYGGAVVTDHPVPPLPAVYDSSTKMSAPPPIRDSDLASPRPFADPNSFPSPRSRNANQPLKRMGSSPHMANGVQVPRRAESISDLGRASGRRPGTGGSQGADGGGRSRSRGDIEREGPVVRSPSVPPASTIESRNGHELPKVVLHAGHDTPPPSAPSVAEASAVVPARQTPPSSRSKPPMPARVPRTLSKILPIDGDGDEDDDEDSTLAYVEEMLEGFDWHPLVGNGMLGPGYGKGRRLAKPSDTAFGASAPARRGTADVIEARLLKELGALEEANIHGMVESDERVGLVIKHMDDALAQLEVMEGMILRFKMQLNSRDEDINHIESQNGALQIHTSNQQKLAGEIERLLDTVHVDEGSIYTLKHASLESRGGIEELERAAGELYKSIVQATSSADESVSAATERLDEYRALSERFCKRVFDHVSLTLTAETNAYLSDPNRQSALAPSRHPGPSLQNHAHLEELLGRYCGLVLYMKETSPSYFSRLCATYYASVSECWKREMVAFFAGWKKRIKRGSGDDYGWEVGGGGGGDVGSTPPDSKISGEFGTFSRAATIRRVVKGDKGKGGKVQDDGDLTAMEVFQRVVDSLTPLLQGEQAFISDFLQINDSNVTFADYLDMEPYFRRRAAQLFGFGGSNRGPGGPMREMKGALELVFGFLAPEWDALVDYTVQMDKSQIIPIVALLDRHITDAEETGSDFIVRTLSRPHSRLTTVLEKIEDEQQQQAGGGGGGGDGAGAGAHAAHGKDAAREKEKEKEKEKKRKRVANLLRKHR